MNRPQQQGALTLEAVEQVGLPQRPAAIQGFLEDRQGLLD